MVVLALESLTAVTSRPASGVSLLRAQKPVEEAEASVPVHIM